MKVMYNGQQIGEVVTNHGMTVEEALEMIGIDVNDQESLKAAYEKEIPGVCAEDMYFYDVDGIELVD